MKCELCFKGMAQSPPLLSTNYVSVTASGLDRNNPSKKEKRQMPTYDAKRLAGRSGERSRCEVFLPSSRNGKPHLEINE